MLGEVVDGTHLRVALVDSLEIDYELSFAAFLQWLSFLWLIELVHFHDGPTDLDNWNFVDYLLYLLHLLLVKSDAGSAEASLQFRHVDELSQMFDSNTA
jgi:hypothetical protein